VIRYPITRALLLERIAAVSRRWLQRAAERTAVYEQAEAYTGGSEFWGDIKQVYIDLQHEKCAYCETKLQGAELASKVHEVEHFRPKASVAAWPDRSKQHWESFPTTIPTGDTSTNGYYRLAYNPLNYAIACTRCNSTLKSNHFPIRGARNVALDDPADAGAEDALLIYPLSDFDADPFELITFDGVIAIPREQRGRDHERALTNIAFFQLNHQDLTTRRAVLIRALWFGLEGARNEVAPEDRAFAAQFVEQLCDESAEFTACMTAFRDLYTVNRATARAMAIF
jgi:5-methylcytosine-specific restriction endonuclease McrA